MGNACASQREQQRERVEEADEGAASDSGDTVLPKDKTTSYLARNWS